jgi:hypothetical protein
MSWKQASGNHDRAFDLCLIKQRLCAKVVRYNGGYAFATFLLPGELRRGKQWTKLGYWIEED